VPQTTQQLKSDIDSGKTGDKIDEGYDLGLSALGTDDEASGTPPTPQEVAMAGRLERAAPAEPAEQGARNPVRGFPAVWVIVAAFVAVLIALGVAIL
jgi:hypothetical protein